MKKYLWMSSAAVVIGTLWVNQSPCVLMAYAHFYSLIKKENINVKNKGYFKLPISF